MTTICQTCGGTVLPPTVTGVPRGSCHCPRNLARRRLELVRTGVPEEGPREHIANALQVLRGFEVTSPAAWHFSPELDRAERRARAALALVQTPRLAVSHARQAVQALIDSPIEWSACPEVRAAAARLLHAVSQMEAVIV